MTNEMQARIAENNAIANVLNAAETEIYGMTGRKVRLITMYAPPGGATEVDLLRLIAMALGMNYGDYSVKKRTEPYTHLRYIATLFLQQYFDTALVQIGRYYNQDHSTIIHGIQAATSLIDMADEVFIKKYDTVLNVITQWDELDK